MDKLIDPFRADLWGNYPLFTGSLVELGRLTEQIIDQFKPGDSPVIVSALNVHYYCKARRNSEFEALQSEVDLVTADGMPIVWMSKASGQPLPERVATTDVIHSIARHNVPGVRFFLLGSTEGEVSRATRSLEEQYSQLTVTGYHHGYFPPSDSARVIASINRAEPHVLWVGMPFPKAQQWVIDRRAELNVPLIFTCGGLFNYLSGKNARAPQWIQEIGLEWFFRVLQEPVRLGPRYLKTNTLFAYYCLKDLLRGIDPGT